MLENLLAPIYWSAWSIYKELLKCQNQNISANCFNGRKTPHKKRCINGPYANDWQSVMMEMQLKQNKILPDHHLEWVQFKRLTIWRVGKDTEKLECSFTAGESKMINDTVENCWIVSFFVFFKANMHLSKAQEFSS